MTAAQRTALDAEAAALANLTALTPAASLERN
jgi:hypothetical protein